ncbi:MAG TPA: ABC transporter permease [Vicinamibacteria bacterium]|nr:ABC transporter permease [Vicinamibacteria bacterium]
MRLGETWSAPLRALLALLLVLAVGAVFHADGAFFQWSTHSAMLRQASVHGILACGMTLVIVTAGIDLAVGSVLGLSAVVFSLLTIHMGWSAVPAVAAVLGTGVLLGAASGGLISGFGLQPFIVTLAMMVFARGLAKLVSGGQKISQAVLRPDGSGYDSVDLPRVFDLIDSRLLGGAVWVVTLVLLAVAAASWLILARLRVGRHAYAVGANPEAARLAGVPVAATLAFAYAFSGLCSAVAGICQAAQEQQGDPETGTGYELSAISMVVIGGTSLMGGRGGVVLTMIGMLTIGYLQKILSLNAVGEAGRLMLTGAIIVGAVLFQRSRRGR